MTTSPNSPWHKFDDSAARLKAARKIAQKIRHREWAANDELHKIRDGERKRRKRGIPIDTPKLKPWDFKKGRVK